MPGFAPGRTVLYRNTQHGRVVNVRPCRVISDDDRGLLLWLARGTPVTVEVADDGRGVRQMPFTEWAGRLSQFAALRRARFDYVVLASPDGTRLSRQGVTWTLSKVERRYQWFNQDGRWGFEPAESVPSE